MWATILIDHSFYVCVFLGCRQIKEESSGSEPAAPRFSKLDNGKVMCLRCLKVFAFLSTARTHFNEQHTSSKEVFSCTRCNKSFGIKRYLNDHLNKTHGITQKMLQNAIP